MNTHLLPIAVIGAGPVGLAAAAHLRARGLTPLVLEAGDAVGASVREWAHVRFFSPWRYSIDSAARALLEARGWPSPAPDDYPTGRDLVVKYLEPLAANPEIAPYLRLNSRVMSVTRSGFDKMKTADRAGAPFALQVRDDAGQEEEILARAVIDASGTWSSPNPLGASGVLARGERAVAGQIFSGIPDVLATHRHRYAGRRVLVVGSGHSAFNALADLLQLAREERGTTITWAVRRPELGMIFGGGENDLLQARGALGQRIRRLVEEGLLEVVTGVRVQALIPTPEGILVERAEGAPLGPVDEIVVATGFRPDLSILSEIQLGLDPVVESPLALAPLIDPNVHSCGTVPPHGAIELAHPEPGFYIVGMKSYGRAPTFLLLTGYEQVRSIAAALAGDWEAAREVQLVLPETGVCSGGGGGDGATCGVPVESVVADPIVASRSPVAIESSAPTTVVAAAVPLLTTANACCAPSLQETCCDLSEKATCCGAAPAGSCGCR
jgi:thioredoxin reductase